MPDPKRDAEFGRLHSQAVTAAQSNDPKADELFLKAAAFAPDLWCNVATKAAKDGKEDMAIDYLRTALHVTDNVGIKCGVFNNLGTLLAKRGQMPQAIKFFEMARDADPDGPEAWHNLGLVAQWDRDLEQCSRLVARSLFLNPWFGEAQFLQAQATMLGGDYKRGFELYESRWRSKSNGLRKLECHKPEWTGEQTGIVYVYGEQGMGDIFLALRYAPLIKERCKSQYWCVKTGQRSIVQTIGCIDKVFEPGMDMEEFDAHIPALSLPRIFGTDLYNIPTAPYIPRPCAREAGDAFRVGICWRGTTLQSQSDHIRSTALSTWADVLAVPGVEFHSLQFDGAAEALVYPAVQVAPEPKDWLETAKRMASMDLVISVDTAIAHLAGAMGIPCWVALHSRPYFVFPYTREDCPWYPTHRLYKQSEVLNWKPVFDKIAHDLAILAGEMQRNRPHGTAQPGP